MYPVSAEFLAAVRQPHKMTMMVERSSSLQGPWTEIQHQVSSGTVKADRKADTRRSLDVKLVGYLQDVLPELSTYNTLLRVKRGIQFYDGSIEWVPLGVYRVYEVNQNGNEFDVTGYSLEVDLRDRRFVNPWFIGSSKGGGTIGHGYTLSASDQMGAIIEDAIPLAQLQYLMDENPTLRAGVTFDRDRLKALQEIAKAVGGMFYTDVNGRFVVSPPATLEDAPVWQVTAGDNGVLIGYSRTVSRESVYNGVVVSSSADLTSGVASPKSIRVLVVDDDPTSPTYWGQVASPATESPFGRVPRFYSSPFITTVDQATSAGRSILAVAKGINASVDFTAVPNPALDIDDVVTIQYRDGSLQNHIIDTLEIGLSSTDPLSAVTRSDRFSDSMEETAV